MNITIKDQEITLKNSFRSHIIFEQITDHTFNGKNLTEIVTYFYCVVMASDPDLSIDFNEFIDWLDDEPERLTEFTEWLVETNKRSNSLTTSKTEETPKPTAKAKKKR